jgi:hypothetical protein
MKPTLRYCTLAVVLSLSGCYTLPGPTAKESFAKQDARLAEEIAAMSQQQRDDIKIYKGPYLGSKIVSDDDRKEWLRNIRVTVEPNNRKNRRTAVSAPELVALLRDNYNINITSSIPLDNYQYTGLGVHNVDGETALKLLFGSIGLDYEIDNRAHYVTIVPLKSQTWTLSIGNRKSSFVAGGNFMDTGTSSSNGSSSSQTSQNTQTSSTQPTTGFSMSSPTAAASGNTTQTASTDNGNSVMTSESVWQSLRTELKDRLTIMIPKTVAATSVMTADVGAAAAGGKMPGGMIMPPSPSMMMSGAGSSTGAKDFYDKVNVGTFSINPETGAVTVQGPRWVLDGIGKYLDEVEARYNTVLSFEGKIILFNTSSDRSEGIDALSFARWAGGRYGAVLSNPALGGVQVSFPASGSLIPSVTVSGQNVAQTSLGIISPADGLQIFNDYLSSLGTVDTIQTPSVETTSGVPVEWETLEPETYIVSNQNVGAGGTGSATVGTTNTEVEVPFGTRMRIFPRYDAKTGLVRAQVYMYYAVKTGTQTLMQVVNGSNGAVSQVPYEKPRALTIKQTMEILAHDGDLIVLSKSASDSSSINNSGITGLGDAMSLFGKRSLSSGRKVYYFALRIRVTRHGLQG